MVDLKEDLAHVTEAEMLLRIQSLERRVAKLSLILTKSSSTFQTCARDTAIQCADSGNVLLGGKTILVQDDIVEFADWLSALEKIIY